MRLYISGKMTGEPNNNFPAFNKAASQLRDLGYEVFNPAENGEGEWHELLKKDIPEVCKSDALVLLPGWINSPGAQFEFDVARRLKIPVYFIEDFVAEHEKAVVINE